MVTHVSQNNKHHVRMVAQLRRQRVVAHEFTHTSFRIPVSAFRGSFFQGNEWLVRILPGPRVAPINKIQVQPRLVMADFVGEPRNFLAREKAPCLFKFQDR